MLIEVLKQIDLAEFMSRCWSTRFEREGESFVALSPFRQETHPSFYVNQLKDGHWVYFDHGVGRGGTIIDAVMAYDGHSDVALAIRKIQGLAGALDLLPRGLGKPRSKGAKPDLEGLLAKLSKNDAKPVRDYLVARGIASVVVDELIARRVLVLNRLHESDYCCFAVRDGSGQLHSLFNRKIDGPALRERFLLGEQHLFCPDWTRLSAASSVHLCESIIDAISLVTLQPGACVLALPGAHFDLGRLDFLPSGALIVEAFDADEAGRGAAKRLKEHFPQRQVESFDLEGTHDVNDLLCRVKQPDIRREGKLSLQDRIDIVMSDESSRKLAAQYGVHHSRICDLRKDAKEVLAAAWEKRRPGRKPKVRPSEEFDKLGQDHTKVKRQCDLLRMRIDWLELQVRIWEERATEAANAGKVRKKKRNRGDADDRSD